MPFSPRSIHVHALTRRTRIVTSALAAILLLAIVATAAFSALQDERPVGHTDRITLAMPATDGPPETTEGELITHLSITGDAPEQVDMRLYLTDMEGRTLMPDPAYTVTVDLTNLNSGATAHGLTLDPVTDASTPTFTLDEPGMNGEGWWRVHTTIERPDVTPLASDFYILLPDPNIGGFEAPPAPDTDPAAAQVLTQTITQMSQWDSLRWWEWLSGGNDSLIMADFAVTTTEANGQPDSFRKDMLFAGGFERRTDGTPPGAPVRNHFTHVTIGDQGWDQSAEGEITETSPARYLPIDQYPETYKGADQIRFGIQEQIDGRSAQVVTFQVPSESPQSQAWFAFWIDADTGDVVKTTMVANNHYMIWIYSDVNESFVIDRPAGAVYTPATPAATPAASPTGTTTPRT